MKGKKNMATRFRVHYGDLQNIGKWFENQASDVEALNRQIRSGMEMLQNSWSGRGSSAFQSEMNDTVLPAVQKLQQALEMSAQAIAKIIGQAHNAENEASQLFKSIAQ
jgi:WXG100 family type VII secretion target